MKKVMDFWLDMGIDGFRADAVPYLIEREGTNCENLPETHAILKDFRAYLDANYENKILLAEANQWPEEVRPYFGKGDEFHMGSFPRDATNLYGVAKRGCQPYSLDHGENPGDSQKYTMVNVSSKP
jgi:glycosidase